METLLNLPTYPFSQVSVFFVFPSEAANYNLPSFLPWFFVLLTIYILVYISTKYYEFVWLPHTNSYISAFWLYEFNPMNSYIIWLYKFIGKLIRIRSFHFIVRICYNDLIVQINRLHVIVRIGRNDNAYKWIPSQWWHCWTNRHIPLVVALFFFLSVKGSKF